MKEGRKVWLVRHAVREDTNPKDWTKTVGHMTDPDLHPIGFTMSRRVGERLANQQVDHILSSPFLRTLRTAHFVSKILGLPVKMEYGFHEQFSSAWFPDGPCKFPSIETRRLEFPELDPGYRSEQRRPDRYENPDDPQNPLVGRVDAAVEHVLNHLEGNLVIITHYAICNCATRSLTGSFASCYIDLTSVTELTYRNGKWENPGGPDCSHVRDILAKGAAWTDSPVGVAS